MIQIDTRRIEQRRASLGLTGAEFAQAVGVTHATYSRLINGHRRSMRTLRKIADYLGVPVSEFVPPDPEPAPDLISAGQDRRSTA